MNQPNQTHELPNEKVESVDAKAPDNYKRKLVLGLASISGLLQACDPRETPARDQPVLPKGADGADGTVATSNTVETAGASNTVNTTGGNQISIDCNCMPNEPPPAGAGGGGSIPTQPTQPAQPAPPQSGGPVSGPAQGIAPRFSAISGPSVSLNTINMDTVTTLSDGRVIRVWGFLTSMGQGFNYDRVLPSPVLEFVQGTPCQFVYSTMQPHTVHLHGMDVDQANDGVPATSGYVVNPSGMILPGFGRVNNYQPLWSPHTYTFVAPHAGTYMYHCHVDTVLHLEMGMAGTIIVRPPDGNQNMLWANGPVFDREFIWQLHTMDTTWHQGFSQSGPGTVRYRPNVFMINGREGANLLADPVTAVRALANETVLIRLVNLGYLPAVVNLGGVTFTVVSSDGRPLRQTIATTDFMVGPGERYDVLFTMPATSPGNASVTYMNIRGIPVPGGVAVTTITTV